MILHVLSVSPDRFVFGPRYFLLCVEVLLLVVLSFTTPRERIFRSLGRRINVFLLIEFAGLANFYGLVELALVAARAVNILN